MQILQRPSEIVKLSQVERVVHQQQFPSSANSLGDFDNQYISIEENIIGIKGVIPFFKETNKSTNMFSVDYQYH